MDYKKLIFSWLLKAIYYLFLYNIIGPSLEYKLSWPA